jgi:hypothetical protein
MLSALLWDEDQACRTEAACALSALTSSYDEGVCAAVKAAGGIPRLVGLLGTSGSRDGSNGGVDNSSSGVDGSSVRLLGMPGSSDGSNGSSSVEDGDSNGGVDGSSSAGLLGVPGSSDTNKGNDSSGTGADSRSCSEPPDGCPNSNGSAACIGDNNTAAAETDNNHNAAAAPDASDALTAAAVTVLGNLAAGSAERRALIATMSGALPGIVSCLSRPESCCRVAALQALLHITASATLSEPWRLADGLVLAQVKAAGRLGRGGGLPVLLGHRWHGVTRVVQEALGAPCTVTLCRSLHSACGEYPMFVTFGDVYRRAVHKGKSARLLIHTCCAP